MFNFFSKHKMVDPREGTFRWNGRIARTVAYYTAAQGFCFDIENLEGGTAHHSHSKRRQKVGTSDELWTAAIQQLRVIWGMGPSDDFTPGEPPSRRGASSPRPQARAQPRWSPAAG